MISRPAWGKVFGSFVMTTLRKFFLVTCGLLALAGAAWSQEASDLFLRAYQDFQAGEKLERDGNPREAFARYRSAAKLLDQIVKSQPDWQPSVIEYRLKKTRENITRLEGQVSALPSAQEGPEGPLPQPDTPLPPPVINTSEPLVPRQTTGGGGRSPTASASPRSTPVPTSEFSALRQQLAAARSENERLQEKLGHQTAELTSARVEIDKRKVAVVELKAQLAQAQDAMETAIKDRNVPKAPLVDDKRVGELNQRIESAEADNEALIEENQRLLAKLENAAKYIEAADAGRKFLEEDRKKIASQRDEVIARTKRIKDNTAALAKLTKEKEELQDQFAKEKTQFAKEKSQFAKEKSELETKLAKATDNEKLEKLTAENKDLSARLSETEKKLAEAAAKPEENEKVLTGLRSEINSLNDRLLESQAQIAKRDDQLKALASQLDESTGEIARLKLNPQPTADEKRTMVENDLLRGIILRQIKEQAGRDAARNGLEKEIQTLQIKSDTISQQLAVLSRPAFQLTDDERLLFKEPIAALSEPDPSSLNVSMVVAKPGNGSPAPTSAEGPESLPAATRDMVDQARKLFEQGRYGDAEKLYQQIVDSAPNNYFALSNLGVTQIQVRKLSAAEVALKKAIEINPKDSFAATNLGIVYCKQGRFDDAISSLQEAVASDDKDHIAQNYLGICYGEKGLKSKAEEAFKQSLQIRDDYPDAHFNLAVLYATTEPPSIDAARLHYKKAVSLGSTPDPSLEKLLQ
ncbi:MAG: tetratricopeptide repeat protein [Verrucomicrobiota bacterium]